MDYLPFSKKLLRPFKLKKIKLPEDLRSGRAINVEGVENSGRESRRRRK